MVLKNTRAVIKAIVAVSDRPKGFAVDIKLFENIEVYFTLDNTSC